ncbi:dentin sialophosphoprotein [Trifolium pratense]|uniref:Dentin sialophosphoprotein n=1 Tax=Trifolium pratense TaxID=57577 RepID=A0A2K3NR41_TRIPR|nr:dentin sialophosphoprotein [Trifolium pratense]
MWSILFADSKKVDELRSPEQDIQLERRMRKKRDDYGDGDKHQDDVGDGYDRHLSSRDDISKDGKKKDDRRNDEKYRDKYRDEKDRENKHRHDKQRDERPAKDHTTIRSDDKHTREEKNNLESRQKRSKHPESDRDHYRDRDGERDRDFEYVRDRERRHERDHDYDFDRDHDYDRDRDRDWDWDRERDFDRERDRDRDRHRDGSHGEDRSTRGKDGGAKKRTTETVIVIVMGHMGKIEVQEAKMRSLTNSRADSDIDRGRSLPRQAHPDSTGTSSKRRSSPVSNAHIGKDEYRNANAEDTKYRDSTIEQRTKASREGYSGISDRGPKYKLMEKSVKIEECPAGDFSTERPSSAKASPMGLMERSPSSTSIERRYMNKNVVKRNLEIEDSGRRSSTDARDISDDRLGPEKAILDEPSQPDSSFYGRTNQNNPPVIPHPPGFRAALDRPYMGSLEDDVRDNSNARYRRSTEPNFGRVHGGNSWRGHPNWTSHVPNGFVPFPPGPGHGGFQTMIPQFSSQPLFGVRPPLEVNHAGIPYHIADADRFPGHLRPLGWPSLMDGTGPAHLHGWDNNNGVSRDDPHMYGGSDWDRHRHPTNSHGWDSETWKEQNSDSKKDLPSPACKDEAVPAVVDNGVPDQTIQVSQDESHEKSPDTKLSSVSSPRKVPSNSLPTTDLEKVPDTSTPDDISSLFTRFYLSKLDISADLVLPELYDQCECALNVGKKASNDVFASTGLSLKNGSRAQQKYAATFSRHSPFSVVDNSIFQRAIDLYKKHRVKLPTKGDLDIFAPSKSDQVQIDEPVPISSLENRHNQVQMDESVPISSLENRHNQVQMEESVPISSLENRQVSVSASDATKDAATPALQPKEVETLSLAKEQLEEINQTCSQMEQDRDCIHTLKIGVSSPLSGPENQEAAVPKDAEEDDKVTLDQLNTEDAEDDHSIAAKSEALLAPTSHEECENMNIDEATVIGFSQYTDEKLDFGDTKGNPLIFEDGSPKACDALMPGTNESESLILSRIHHSPESTH